MLVLIAIFAGTVSLSGTAYTSSNQFIEASNWVIHTHEAIEHIALIENDIDTAESSQRATLLSGYGPYEDLYHAEIAKTYSDLAYFKILTCDNPVQQANCDIVLGLITKRVSLMDNSIVERKRFGLGRTRHLLRTGKGFSQMADIRDALARCTAEEDGLLVKRVRWMRDRSTQCKQVTLADMYALGLFICIAFFFAARGHTGTALDVPERHDGI